jgi:hypothetical protein
MHDMPINGESAAGRETRPGPAMQRHTDTRARAVAHGWAMLTVEKIRRRLTEWIEPAAVPLWMSRLRIRNRYCRGSLLSVGGPVVSLTTHGKRLKSVFYTIETIGMGTRRPGRLILWIDDPVAYADLPMTLRRLQARGLEIRLTANRGPHTKYFPYVEQLPANSPPVVTADDDILYPAYWLAGLLSAYRQDDSVINCYRAHEVRLEGGGIAAYSRWKPCESRRASFSHFATGVSGVIYPPDFLQLLKAAGSSFIEHCPKADDVWLHAMAVRGGFRIRQIFQLPRHFYNVPGTQDIGLVHSNSFAAGNDRQIASTYRSEDVDLMRSEMQPEASRVGLE